jgi:hypothetical protein
MLVNSDMPSDFYLLISDEYKKKFGRSRSKADFFLQFKYILQTLQNTFRQTFLLKVANRKSSNFYMIYLQIANPQIFMIYLQIANHKFLKNTAQPCLKTVLKVIF